MTQGPVHNIAGPSCIPGFPAFDRAVDLKEQQLDVVVRAASVEDYQDVYEVLACPGVVRDTLQLPYVSIDRRKKGLEDPPEGTYSLVAEVDGRVVGDIGLTRGKGRRAHVGHIGMEVHDDFQGRGIGSKLMEAALDLADNWLGLKRVELTVYTDNAPAIRLYEKFGFEIEGTLRALAMREGKYVDAYAMAQIGEL